jgi:hypothetical protein
MERRGRSETPTPEQVRKASEGGGEGEAAMERGSYGERQE